MLFDSFHLYLLALKHLVDEFVELFPMQVYRFYNHLFFWCGEQRPGHFNLLIQILATVSPRCEDLLPRRTTCMCRRFSSLSAGKTERIKRSMNASLPIFTNQVFNLQKYDIYLDFSHIISNSLVFKDCNAGRAKFIFHPPRGNVSKSIPTSSCADEKNGSPGTIKMGVSTLE